MTEEQKQATRAELAEHMRQHYDRVSKAACSFCSTIPKAIDAWVWQPELLARIKKLEDYATRRGEIEAERNLDEAQRRLEEYNRLPNAEAHPVEGDLGTVPL